jgi:hypothetical protein
MGVFLFWIWECQTNLKSVFRDLKLSEEFPVFFQYCNDIGIDAIFVKERDQPLIWKEMVWHWIFVKK